MFTPNTTSRGTTIKRSPESRDTLSKCIHDLYNMRHCSKVCKVYSSIFDNTSAEYWHNSTRAFTIPDVQVALKLSAVSMGLIIPRGGAWPSG